MKRYLSFILAIFCFIAEAPGQDDQPVRGPAVPIDMLSKQKAARQFSVAPDVNIGLELIRVIRSKIQSEAIGGEATTATLASSLS